VPECFVTGRVVRKVEGKEKEKVEGEVKREDGVPAAVTPVAAVAPMAVVATPALSVAPAATQPGNAP
jgi:hypothetical protein